MIIVISQKEAQILIDSIGNELVYARQYINYAEGFDKIKQQNHINSLVTLREKILKKIPNEQD